MKRPYWSFHFSLWGLQPRQTSRPWPAMAKVFSSTSRVGHVYWECRLPHNEIACWGRPIPWLTTAKVFGSTSPTKQLSKMIINLQITKPLIQRHHAMASLKNLAVAGQGVLLQLPSRTSLKMLCNLLGVSTSTQQCLCTKANFNSLANKQPRLLAPPHQEDIYPKWFWTYKS